MMLSMFQAVSEFNRAYVSLHVTEGLLSLVYIPLEETAIRGKLGPKMASLIRLDLTVTPNDRGPTLYATLNPSFSTNLVGSAAIKTTNMLQWLRLWDTYLHLC